MLPAAAKMTEDVVDEEMTVDHEVAIVEEEEEAEMIVVVLPIDMIAVVAIDTTEIGTIEATEEIGMIEMQEAVVGIGLLLVATVGHHLLVMVDAVAPVRDRLEAVEEVVTDPEVHREEVMMIAIGGDMMTTGTMDVVIGAPKTTGVGEVLTIEGMVALSLLREQSCF